MSISDEAAVMMAGIPAVNRAFYRRIAFSVGDPAVHIQWPAEDGKRTSLLILRDIELQRAGRHARADHVGCPADFAPPGGLSGDRETATAQAAAHALRQRGVGKVVVDRTLPYVYASHLLDAGIEVVYDPDLGVIDRRAKDEREVELLREAQNITEQIMRVTLERIANARADVQGALHDSEGPLTSESLRQSIDIWLMRKGYSNPDSIVACGPQGADCHDHGSGSLHTGQPVIVDIFPQNRRSLYNGDCTRTVVHGEIPDRLREMHEAVLRAKKSAIEATRAGVTGQQVHEATSASILASGFAMGLPKPGDSDDYCAMTHGTGHGIGLDVHEPPLLDRGGPTLVVGDALTIEPGLYCRSIGGVRVEDMVIVRQDKCDNLNQLPQGLSWK